jgi:hypothetical protein
MKQPRVMAAIAMAETRGSGDTNAHNTTPPDDSYGPWQINMYGPLGPSRRKAFGLSKNEDLFNPLTNALAAKKIANSQGLSAWSTYNDGLYKQYMNGSAAEPVDQASVETVASIPDVAGSVADVASLSLDAARWISTPNNWLRIAYVTGGLIVTVVALKTLMIPSGGKVSNGINKAVAKGATTVMPAGKVMKGLK